MTDNPTPAPEPTPEPRRNLLAKVRQVSGRFVLVDEDRTLALELRELKDRVARLEEDLRRARAETERYRREAAQVELRTGHHTDLVVAELWRRAESVDSRLATELQRLAETVGRESP
ncbi:MAG: hypothetical protein U0V73_04820 [Acidimicrobiia bacterium]